MAQGQCRVAGYGVEPGELGVRTYRNGGIAKLRAGVGILLEGLLGMGYNRIVLYLNCVQPQVSSHWWSACSRCTDHRALCP